MRSPYYLNHAPVGVALLAGSAFHVLQVRLASLRLVALRLADNERAAAQILCLVKLIGCQVNVCQVSLLRWDLNRTLL